MIEQHVVVIIGFICAVVGGGFVAICFKVNDANKKIKNILNIEVIREQIIEAAIDHAYIEDSRSEGDYDINVSKPGEIEIDKILEGML